MLQYDFKEIDGAKELVDHIDEYIRANFSKSINLEDISRKFNFNASYLTKIFRKHKGETPLKCLITYRIDEAKRLTQNQPDLDIKHIGEIVGYPDQAYFSRIFKNITGKSPTEYKEL